MVIPRTQGNTLDDYIVSFPKNVQDILEKLRRVIKESVPTTEETINYGMPTFRLNGNLVHFASFKNHIGFFLTPSASTAFKKELSSFKQAKGSVQFPIEKPIPSDLEKNCKLPGKRKFSQEIT